MARRKKKKTSGPPPARSERFNAPFSGLGKKLRLTPPPKDPPPPPEPETPPPPASEDDLFAQAMAGVTRLSDRDRGQVPPRPGFEGPPVRINPQVQEDLEVLARLADMVRGTAPLDIQFSDEYAEGFAPGLNPELAERLRQGAFPIQDYVDLHGLSKDEARVAVEEFIRNSRVKGYRSVLIVHGRGLGSRDQVPVLKREVVDGLSRKRFRSQVLGFCTARPLDGGTGALYVLLTRWRG